MSDNTRFVPPPMPQGGPRTLGDVRNRGVGGNVGDLRTGTPQQLDNRPLSSYPDRLENRELTQQELQDLRGTGDAGGRRKGVALRG